MVGSFTFCELCRSILQMRSYLISRMYANALVIVHFRETGTPIPQADVQLMEWALTRDLQDQAVALRRRGLVLVDFTFSVAGSSSTGSSLAGSTKLGSLTIFHEDSTT